MSTVVSPAHRPRSPPDTRGRPLCPPPPRGGRRAPLPAAWDAFVPFLGALPGLLAEAGVRDVHFRGGAHLSAALAVGAAVPLTTTWHVSVAGTGGEVWEDGSTGVAVDVSSQASDVSPAGHLAVMVDCVPGEAQDTLSEFVSRLGDDLCASLTLRPSRDDMLDPAYGAVTASALARCIPRRGRLETHDHRAPRDPGAVPLAVMLGRRLNTLELVLQRVRGDR